MVDSAILHPLLFSLAAQQVLEGVLKLSHAFAEHLEEGDQSSLPVREDFGRGLSDGRGVHGGCGECERLVTGEGGAVMSGMTGEVL